MSNDPKVYILSMKAWFQNVENIATQYFYYGIEDLIMAKDHFGLENVFLAENSNMHLKTNIRELIKFHGITVAHLARSTKIPLQTLHGWLSGADPRNMNQLKKIADYFNHTIDELCFDQINPKAKKHSKKEKIEEYADEINAGTFEVVLRRIKKTKD